jgi:dimeric dUTPase (all-alpha-NTP-PPase superfamily)
VRFLERQLKLQREAYGDRRPRPLTGEELGESVRMNVQACVDELHEALHECKGWKSWSSRTPEIEDRDAFVEELIDAKHFLGNLFLAVGVDDDELDRRYEEKALVNEERQRDGYTP